MEDYLTVSEVASMCRVHPETVRVWLRGGRLAGVHLGGHWRVLRENVLQLLRGGDDLGGQAVKASSPSGGSFSSPGAVSATSRGFSAGSRSLTPRVIG